MPRIDKTLAIIVPTKDRPQDLAVLIESINRQNTWPGQLIIVDGGSAPLEKVLSRFSSFNLCYTRQRPASLPRQKNLGLALLQEGIETVAFFDDDVILEKDMIDTVMKFWSQAPADTAGVAANNISHPRPRVSLLEKIFLVGTDRVGAILPSGFQGRLCSLDKDYRVQWLIGGVTFWKKDVFKEHKFDEWFYGYAYGEDVDFSYRLSKRYKLFALKDAKFIHQTKPIRRQSQYHLGVMQAVNRVYFVKKHRELSLILCYWSCLGLLLKNLFLGTLGCKPRYLLRGAGIFSGMLSSLFGNKRIKKAIK